MQYEPPHFPDAPVQGADRPAAPPAHRTKSCMPHSICICGTHEDCPNPAPRLPCTTCCLASTAEVCSATPDGLRAPTDLRLHPRHGHRPGPGRPSAPGAHVLRSPAAPVGAPGGTATLMGRRRRLRAEPGPPLRRCSTIEQERSQRHARRPPNGNIIVSYALAGTEVSAMPGSPEQDSF